MFARLGRFAYRRRWLVVACWLALFVASLPVLPRVPGQLAVGGFSSPRTEAARARAILQAQIPSYSPSELVVIFHSDRLAATSPEYVAQASAALAELPTLPQVTGVVPFTANPRQIAADGHTAYTVVRLSLPPEQAQRLMDRIRRTIQPTELQVSLAGGPAFYADIERTTERDLRRAEVVAIPFALVALVLVFGSVVTAGIPIAVGGLSVAAVLGAIYLLAQVVDLSIFVLNLSTMLGLGLAIDYSLFMTSRFREELAHRPVEEAVAVTVATAGRAVFFSGITVLIGLGGLVFFDFMFLRSVGIAGALVVAFALCGALTLLPAVLAIIGHRVDALALFRRRQETGAFWQTVSHLVMDRAWVVLVAVATLIVLLGLPFRHVKLSSPDATILPRSTPSRQAFETLRARFGDGEISPLVLAITSSDPINAPQNIAALYDLTRQIAADPRVWSITSLVTVDPRVSLEQYQYVYADPTRIADPVARAAYEQFAGPRATVVYVYTRFLPGSGQAQGRRRS
ncbi:MAG: MMPL family transporter, partial [Thermomicrobiaceae bacterium]|nr:MMPL family transporter [Thermomicrobiaceae bacterium]